MVESEVEVEITFLSFFDEVKGIEHAGHRVGGVWDPTGDVTIHG